jgi:Zn-dependent M32 family carboxypeptidase
MKTGTDMQEMDASLKSENDFNAFKEKLIKFLAETRNLLNQAEKSENDCYNRLRQIAAIAENLIAGEQIFANILSVWLQENCQKFVFCATEDDFNGIMGEIEKNLERVADPETNGVLENDPHSSDPDGKKHDLRFRNLMRHLKSA